LLLHSGQLHFSHNLSKKAGWPANTGTHILGSNALQEEE